MTETTTRRAVEGRVLATGFELRAAGTDGGYTYLQGRAVPYNVETTIGGFFKESFAPGSLAKSIAEAARSLPLLAFHINDQLDAHIGVAEEWNDNQAGLDGLWRLDKSEAAQRVARMADPEENGGQPILGYMSIRFAPIRSAWTYVDEWDPNRGPDYLDSVVRTEARLLETSVVSTPAYKDATISKVRSADRAMAPEAAGRVLRGWKDWLDRQTRQDDRKNIATR